MRKTQTTDVAVIGGGLAGLAAATLLGRAERTVIEGLLADASLASAKRATELIVHNEEVRAAAA